MFFNKKLWDDFEEEIKKWENEEEIDNNFGVDITGLDRLKLAAQILTILINDERARNNTSKDEATKVVISYIEKMLK